MDFGHNCAGDLQQDTIRLQRHLRIMFTLHSLVFANLHTDIGLLRRQ